MVSRESHVSGETWVSGETEEQVSSVSRVLGGLIGVKRESCVRRNMSVRRDTGIKREEGVMRDAFAFVLYIIFFLKWLRM